MDVIAVDQFTQTADIQVPIGTSQKVSVSITPTNDLASVLSKMDYISIHVPKQADGSAVLGAKEFDLMKKGVRIVNAARGGVVDEKDLIAALDSGKVAFAGLDVFENEPNPNSELVSHPKIACTPHIGAATVEAQDRIGSELAELIIAEFGKQN
jgi:D-3-phosphoglycerate dehydrogenase